MLFAGGTALRRRLRPSLGSFAKALTGTFALAVGSLTGCAFPMGTGHEILVGYLATGPGGRAMQRVVPGVDVRTLGRDEGLTIGWSDTRAVTAAASAGDERRCKTGVEAPAALRFAVGDTCRRIGVILHGEDSPPSEQASWFEHSMTVGAGLRLDRYGRGLTLGYANRTTTVPANDSAIHVLHYRSRDPLHCEWTAGMRFEAENGGTTR